MSKYIVTVPEVYLQKYEVSADNPTEAIERVLNCGGSGLVNAGIVFGYMLSNQAECKVEEVKQKD